MTINHVPIYDRRLETLSQTGFETGFSNSIYLRHEFFSHFYGAP